MSALTAVGGCGLEDIIVLSPPEYFEISEGLDYFKIRIDESNDEPEFRGIEIYYKLYEFPTGSPQVTLSTQTDLLNADFRRLSTVDDKLGVIEYPLIPVPISDRGERATITLDFYPLGHASPAQPSLKAEPDSAGLTLAQTEFRRGVAATDSTFKRFYSESNDGFGFNSGDLDIKDLNLDPGDHDVYIALYALSYGKQDLATTVYSRAVPLQYITVRIHVTGD